MPTTDAEHVPSRPSAKRAEHEAASGSPASARPDDDDAWDRQMRADVRSGKLDDVIKAASKRYREGKADRLP
jgi:hypothetical protein